MEHQSDTSRSTTDADRISIHTLASAEPENAFRPVGASSRALNSRDSMCSTVSSIGVSAEAEAINHAPRSLGPLLDNKLRYYRTLSRRMESPADALLLDPPIAVVEAGLQRALLLGSARPGAAGSLSIIFTVWNTMMGSTLLVMPYGFATSGWLLGAGLCAFCAVVSKYTCSLVLSYGFAMPDGSAEFADLARTHFGRGGWAVAIAASLLVVLGAACAMHGCAPRAILRRAIRRAILRRNSLSARHRPLAGTWRARSSPSSPSRATPAAWACRCRRRASTRRRSPR